MIFRRKKQCCGLPRTTTVSQRERKTVRNANGHKEGIRSPGDQRCKHMTSLVDNVEYWRNRAEEARVLAESIQEETPSKSCLGLRGITNAWPNSPRRE